MQVMRIAVLGLGTAVLLGLIPPATSAESSFSGAARSIDGDSLYVGGREVRLFGIDAPEYHQTCTRGGRPWGCGSDAAAQLSKLVTGRQVRCDKVDMDEHGRTVARCSVDDLDVNRTMVALGYAIAYRYYSNDYVNAEETAKANKRGLWAGTFELPSQYRHKELAAPSRSQSVRQREVRVVRSRSSSQPSGNCLIKGNQGSHGWIYHLPGMPFYERTKAEEIFCTEAEAQAAGYRKAKVR